MCKRLQDMTLKELWQLFPIVLTPHNPQWIAWAKEETLKLTHILEVFSPQIHHIGSTAIPHIQAKPIIDILVEVSSADTYERIKTIMERNGYILMSESLDRLSFNKGYTPKGYD